MPRILKRKNIAPIIEKQNLITCDGRTGSGSWDNSRFKLGVDGAFVVKEKKDIIGWAVAWCHGEIHIFVIPTYRRKGIGTRLMKKMVKTFPTHRFCPWNAKTLRLFTKEAVNFTTMYLPDKLR